MRLLRPRPPASRGRKNPSYSSPKRNSWNSSASANLRQLRKAAKEAIDMLALGIRYLNGFVVASHGLHEEVEWPPHPGRVFMALVAAHYQTGADPAEREALLWLEALPGSPEIHASEHLSRTVVTQ